MTTFEDIEKFWDTRPCNIKHSKKPINTKEYFQEVEEKKYFVEQHIPIFADFPKWQNKKVLEIGCGIGTDSINFVRHGANLTTIELSEKSLDICRKRFDIFGLQANLIHGNVEELSSFLPFQHFDLIYSFGVLHHTLSPDKAIAELVQYMGYNSELRIMLYAKYSWKLLDLMHQTNQWDFSVTNELIQKHSEAQTGCPCTHTFTINQVHKLLYQFTILSIERTHIFPYKMPEYLDNNYIIIDSLKNISNTQFQELEKELGWHLLIKAKIK